MYWVKLKTLYLCTSFLPFICEVKGRKEVPRKEGKARDQRIDNSAITSAGLNDCCRQSLHLLRALSHLTVHGTRCEDVLYSRCAFGTHSCICKSIPSIMGRVSVGNSFGDSSHSVFINNNYKIMCSVWRLGVTTINRHSEPDSNMGVKNRQNFLQLWRFFRQRMVVTLKMTWLSWRQACLSTYVIPSQIKGRKEVHKEKVFSLTQYILS